MTSGWCKVDGISVPEGARKVYFFFCLERGGRWMRFVGGLGLFLSFRSIWMSWWVRLRMMCGLGDERDGWINRWICFTGLMNASWMTIKVVWMKRWMSQVIRGREVFLSMMDANWMKKTDEWVTSMHVYVSLSGWMRKKCKSWRP